MFDFPSSLLVVAVGAGELWDDKVNLDVWAESAETGLKGKRVPKTICCATGNFPNTCENIFCK